jgi:hypothetical protein
MVANRRVMGVNVVAAAHLVLAVAGISSRADRRRLGRTQHGSRDRTPNGEQDGEQDQKEGAEVLHER